MTSEAYQGLGSTTVVANLSCGVLVSVATVRNLTEQPEKGKAGMEEWRQPAFTKPRILQFLALVVQNVMLILFQSSILFKISPDLFYFVVAYSLILKLGRVLAHQGSGLAKKWGTEKLSCRVLPPHILTHARNVDMIHSDRGQCTRNVEGRGQAVARQTRNCK